MSVWAGVGRVFCIRVGVGVGVRVGVGWGGVEYGRIMYAAVNVGWVWHVVGGGW